MTPTSRYTANYRTVEVNTSDELGLIIILYKEAIGSLSLAKASVEQGLIEQRVSHLNRAISFIGELQANLNFEKGGSIASSLNQLYQYSIRRLGEANIRQSKEMIDEVIALLTTLKSAWEEARHKSFPYEESDSSPKTGRAVERFAASA